MVERPDSKDVVFIKALVAVVVSVLLFLVGVLLSYLLSVVGGTTPPTFVGRYVGQALIGAIYLGVVLTTLKALANFSVSRAVKATIGLVETGVFAVVLVVSLVPSLVHVPPTPFPTPSPTHITSHCDVSQPWATTPRPTVAAASSVLSGLAAVSATDVWAVGSSSDDAYKTARPLIERWDGHSWHIISSPRAGMKSDLTAIAVSPGGDVWATGYVTGVDNRTRPLIARWNGSTWSVVPPAADSSRNSWLDAVAVVSASEVWATGYTTDADRTEHTLIERWDGSAWHVVQGVDPGLAKNEPHALVAVPGTSPAQLWAVGSYDDDLDDGIWQPLLERWDGNGWTAITAPVVGASNNSLFAVAAASADDVWAVGAYSDSKGGSWSTLIEHWDGLAWSVVPSPAAMSDTTRLTAVTHLNAATQPWAVGLAGPAGSKSLHGVTLTLPC